MPGVGVEGGVRGGDLHAAALPRLRGEKCTSPNAVAQTLVFASQK
jgi:hypothetical protein